MASPPPGVGEGGERVASSLSGVHLLSTWQRSPGCLRASGVCSGWATNPPSGGPHLVAWLTAPTSTPGPPPQGSRAARPSLAPGQGPGPRATPPRFRGAGGRAGPRELGAWRREAPAGDAAAAASWFETRRGGESASRRGRGQEKQEEAEEETLRAGANRTGCSGSPPRGASRPWKRGESGANPREAPRAREGQSGDPGPPRAQRRLPSFPPREGGREGRRGGEGPAEGAAWLG